MVRRNEMLVASAMTPNTSCGTTEEEHGTSRTPAMDDPDDEARVRDANSPSPALTMQSLVVGKEHTPGTFAHYPHQNALSNGQVLQPGSPDEFGIYPPTDARAVAGAHGSRPHHVLL